MLNINFFSLESIIVLTFIIFLLGSLLHLYIANDNLKKNLEATKDSLDYYKSKIVHPVTPRTDEKYKDWEIVFMPISKRYVPKRGIGLYDSRKGCYYEYTYYSYINRKYTQEKDFALAIASNSIEDTYRLIDRILEEIGECVEIIKHL